MFTTKAVNANGNHKYPELKLCLSYLFRKSEDERRRFLAFDVFKFTQFNGAITVKTVHAWPLTSKFLVQPSSAECGGLETGHKDSRQMFQHSDRMFEQIFQISFKISFGA